MRENKFRKQNSRDSRGVPAPVLKGKIARCLTALFALVILTASAAGEAPAAALADEAMQSSPETAAADMDTNGAQLSIPAACQSRPDGDWDGDFLIVIEAVGADAPLPSEELRLKADESGQLGPMIYTRAGDYHYRVFEQDEGNEDWKLDETVYEVTVRIVYDKEGNLVGSMWLGTEDAPDKMTSITFINERTNVKDAGRTPAPGETPEPGSTKTPGETQEPGKTPEPGGTQAPDGTETPKTSSGSNNDGSGSAIGKLLNAIKTGDDAAITGCVLLAASAAALIWFLLCYRRKKRPMRKGM